MVFLTKAVSCLGQQTQGYNHYNLHITCDVCIVTEVNEQAADQDGSATAAELRGIERRRERILDAALAVFGRYGFQKSSMNQVAQAAKISRPRLYFHFVDKQDLFRATVDAALADSLTAVEVALGDDSRCLQDRVVQALDEWQGRFAGHVGGEIGELIAGSEDLLGGLFADYAARFVERLREALAADWTALRQEVDLEPGQVAETLHALGNGVQRESRTRDEFVERIGWGVRLVCRTDGAGGARHVA
jgi:AcrR family transcriptional regulator